VVHVDHGIGRYIGLVHRTVDEVERDYLCLEYADDAQLYVPVHQADRLTRYVGPDNRTPALGRLGSSEWRNVKSHVKEAVREVAEDLLELYARRSVVEGFAFGPDTPWQSELEASFPYIETEDQTQVLGEVKRDMQSIRPMDRLICGDVGYGKTEVALRAAFKAVMDSRQVAILVPTTVLAQQHFNTFQQRLAAFPVEVEMLSRFRTPQQQVDILKRLSQGKVDIVIGTHRLLSSDVHFKDLGLLIIDEEQRFGVTHKETLKKMRTEVDVLTLTATPIPRTLYMALSGVRDISTINTPPEERLPVVTHVGPYSPRLVRQAILRELERGGQVFFVHNRVQTISAMSSHLRQLIPEARITIAHGQMAETDLAARMEEFTAGKIDILLSTSIIESGLDIPNANTLIVDRADTFGLAQLYQLRGRVGRGAQRAYAYFFRHKRKPPTHEGRQRLETIAENTQLGSGYSIAMRDLEIRGSGDILGTRQHGHIAAVGFHLYTALLAEAVIRMRREEGLMVKGGVLPGVVPGMYNLQLVPVNVELPLAVGIPASYVPDQTVRLGLYRRLADVSSLSELETLKEEFLDRFGRLPETVENLFYQLTLKLLAEKAGLASITTENGQIVMRYPDNQIPADLPDPGQLVRVGKTALWMPYEELEDWTGALLQILTYLKLD
jgi:transcription-repair coupling factor (superfamily II helicase)